MRRSVRDMAYATGPVENVGVPEPGETYDDPELVEVGEEDALLEALGMDEAYDRDAA
jgi:hypothetical protein